MKFPYDLPFLPGASPPERWDVVVFRYPEDPETSYIKRLVGLPGETLRIWHGDLFIRPPGGTAPFALQRKPLKHQRAMQMMVNDDRHRPSALKDLTEWRRWTSPGGDLVRERDDPRHLRGRSSGGRLGPSFAIGTSSPTRSSGARSRTPRSPLILPRRPW